MIQNRDVLPREEHELLETNIRSMVEHLDAICLLNRDSSSSEYTPPVLTSTAPTENRGRPRINIDPAFLDQALQLRGPTALAKVLGVSSRTIRRRALEAQLVQPGSPVYMEEVQGDGSLARVYNSTSNAQSIELDDNTLDDLIKDTLLVFPNFGKQMMQGDLRAQGYKVSRQQIEASYIRVRGVPARFGHRPIVRRVYRVAGPNALRHHDGQHGEPFRKLAN